MNRVSKNKDALFVFKFVKITIAIIEPKNTFMEVLFMKKKDLGIIRRLLMKEIEMYNQIEELMLEYRAKLNELMDLCSRAVSLEGFEIVDNVTNTMSNLASDLRELDEDSKKCLSRINTYRKVLGLQPMLG